MSESSKLLRVRTCSRGLSTLSTEKRGRGGGVVENARLDLCAHPGAGRGHAGQEHEQTLALRNCIASVGRRRRVMRSRNFRILRPAAIASYGLVGPGRSDQGPIG